MAELTLVPETDNTFSIMEEMGTGIYDDLMKYYTNKRVLIINKDIDNSVIESYAIRILRWNDEDKNILPEKRQPITLLIHSCGGDLFIIFILMGTRDWLLKTQYFFNMMGQSQLQILILK